MPDSNLLQLTEQNALNTGYYFYTQRSTGRYRIYLFNHVVGVGGDTRGESY